MAIISIHYNNIKLAKVTAETWGHGDIAAVWQGKKHEWSDDQTDEQFDYPDIQIM